jgi:5-(carboxyamino)imidazole ribonucleotide synthase
VPAARAAKRSGAALDYVGVLTLEFFATQDGPVFNEMAPRVHNSGHWSIEGASPASSRTMSARSSACRWAARPGHAGAVMDNLIGDAADAWPQLLADPANHLHLYGKAETRPGRKMGHVTRLVK